MYSVVICHLCFRCLTGAEKYDNHVSVVFRTVCKVFEKWLSTLIVSQVTRREQRKWSDSGIWQKSLYQQKNQNNWQHKNATKTSITQRLWTDLGPSVGPTGVINRVYGYPTLQIITILYCPQFPKYILLFFKCLLLILIIFVLAYIACLRIKLLKNTFFSHLWLKGVHKCPPWYSFLCQSYRVSVPQILHYGKKSTLVLWHMKTIHIVKSTFIEAF